MLIHITYSGVPTHTRVTAPRVKIKVGSWKLELLANFSEGRKTPSLQEFCVIAYYLLFFSVTLSMAAKT